MDSDLRFMFGLIGAAVFGSEIPAQPKETDWQQIYLLSKKHNISNIICYGILKGNYEIPQSYLGMFKQDMFANLIISENQDKEIKNVTSGFEKNGIDFMCLKGAVLKNLYPSHDMRRMADADILIKIAQRSEADEVMKSLGYEFILESNHEYIYYKKPVMHVELHKYLIPSYNDDMYSYYGSGWDIAKKKTGAEHEFELSVEDNFIFLVTHLAKHYRDGGIGIKAFIDVWLYMHKFNIDMTYVNSQFEKLSIKKFADNLFELLNVWFGDGKETTVTNNMTGYILTSGEYGNQKNKDDVAALRQFDDLQDFNKIRNKKILYSVFPPLNKMTIIFPILKKAPWLLPVMWVVRWIRSIFVNKSVKNIKNISENVTADSMKAYSEHMKEVGIDIYNGRK